MKKLVILATKFNNEGELFTAFRYEHEGEAFAVITKGYLTIYEADTHTTKEKVLRLSDYFDVNIYNY